jgi:hypothetical protein
MPAVSKQQQKLFGVVHAYQTGKISADKVNDTIKKIAKSISPEDAKKFASSRVSIDEVKTVFTSPTYIQETLREIVDTKTPAHVKGELVDIFTAQMLTTVLKKLNEHNKTVLLQKPLTEMVAISYKILTY